MNKNSNKQPAKQATAAEDSVVISEKAREQLAQLADRALTEIDPAAKSERAEEFAAGGDLRHEKILLAKTRIRSGYYNQADVKRAIADRLADELIDRPPDEPETSE